MKCLSLWQPWATLIAIGAKKIETRCWYTPHRGKLAIHAAKLWNKDLAARCMQPPFRRVLGLQIVGENTWGKHDGLFGADELLPRGAIVAVVDLVDCSAILLDGKLYNGETVMEPELSFGDYSYGRFAWLLGDDACRLPEPVPFRGAQGLFDVPDELVSGR